MRGDGFDKPNPIRDRRRRMFASLLDDKVILSC